MGGFPFLAESYGRCLTRTACENCGGPALAISHSEKHTRSIVLVQYCRGFWGGSGALYYCIIVMPIYNYGLDYLVILLHLMLALGEWAGHSGA